MTLFLPPAAVLPAHAGQWQFTASGTMTFTSQPSGNPPAYVLPVSALNSLSLPSYTVAETVGPAPFPTSNIQSWKLPLTLSAVWVPDPQLASDPAPAVVRISEFSQTSYLAGSSDANSASGAADDGFSDPLTVSNQMHTSSGTHQKQYSLTKGSFSPLNRTLSASATASFATYGVTQAQAYLNQYNIQAMQIPATLTVDQDQGVFPPAATTRFSATISNAGGFTIDWVKISVDGTPAAATVNPSNSNNYYIDWPQTGGNPSEHTVTATAQIHDSLGVIPMDSTDPSNRIYAPSGMGRPADDIIADVHLQSIKFNSNIALNQDSVTPVSTPEITLIGTPTTTNPAAYVQGKNVNFTMLLSSSTGATLTGSATMGYLLKLQASPNTTNPATNAADPVLTLYDNTTGSPTVPASCSASTTVAATTALNSWVAAYTTSFPVLTFYVEFTKIPTPTWSVLSSYNSSVGNTVYTTVAAPSAPMASPWVSVLSYACNWAKRTSDATNATTALAKGLYGTFTYDGSTTHTVWSNPPADGVETFRLPSFMSAAQGDCRDFSDFMVCSSNALGAKALQSQRSDTVANINKDQVEFRTKNFIAAPYQQQAVPSSNSWVYHQWSVADNVFDACIGTTPTPLVNLPLSTYFSTLVDQTLPYRWNPQAAFTPTVSN